MSGQFSVSAQAEQLRAAGRVDEALALLDRAPEHSDALHLRAIWLLAGVGGPRDLPHARRLLRAAASRGHGEAALIEIALTANGSGGPADWQGAFTLLRGAAVRDPVAAAQLASVERIALTPDGRPVVTPQAEPLDPAGAVVRFPRLLTPEECGEVARAAAELLAPAFVVDPRTGQSVPHPIRTSDGAVIGPTRENLVVRAINARIAAASGFAIEQGESLAVLRYRPGQQYRLHLDTLPGVANQRVATVLVYLNEGFDGGETAFPDLGMTVTPRGGDAILFRNTLPDGRDDPRARHAGLPVTRGIKWLATRWIRARPLDPWNPVTAA